MELTPSFESAWLVKAEGDLPLQDYSRRKAVLRRQKITHIARRLGWHMLRVGEALPPGACLLAGISLDKGKVVLSREGIGASKYVACGK